MKSILVLGLGRFGRHLANKLQQLGNEVMVIDKDEALVEKYSNTFTDAQIGDCTDEAVIRSLGVNQFDVCFVTICKLTKKTRLFLSNSPKMSTSSYIFML